MESIDIRWGEAVSLPVYIDDDTALSATLYVAKEGEAPIIIAETELENGEGFFELSGLQTRKEEGLYKYQINVYYDGLDDPEKFPAPDDDCDECDDIDLPDFRIYTSLDKVS